MEEGWSVPEWASRRVLLLVALAFGLALAGCVGGDEFTAASEDDPSETDPASEDTEQSDEGDDQGEDASGDEDPSNENDTLEPVEEPFQMDGATTMYACGGAVLIGYCQGHGVHEGPSTFHDPELAPVEAVTFQVTWEEPVEMDVTVHHLENGTDKDHEVFSGSSPITATVTLETDNFEIEVSSFTWANAPGPVWAGAGTQPPVEFTLEGTATVLR